MHFSPNRFFQRQQGLGLIEFLITLAVSFLLFTSILNLYLNAWRAFQKQTHLMKIQTHLLSSQHMLKDAVAKAGRVGCANLRNVSVKSWQKYGFSTENGLSGDDHTFLLRYADFPNSVLIKQSEDKGSLLINKAVRYHEGDVLIIADCTHAELFQLDKIHVVQGRFCAHPKLPLHYSYNNHAEIARFQLNRFYISNSRTKSGLYVQDIKQKNQLLFDHITAMQIKYYIKEQTRTRLVPWKFIEDWSKVVALKISLTVRIKQHSKQLTFIAPMVANDG